LHSGIIEDPRVSRRFEGAACLRNGGNHSPEDSALAYRRRSSQLNSCLKKR